MLSRELDQIANRIDKRDEVNFINEDMDKEKASVQAYEWTQELLDGTVYTMTNKDFGNVVKGTDLESLYDEDIDEDEE